MYPDDEAVEGEENVYNEDAREELVENDEMSAEEEGFMKGYEETDEEKEKKEKKTEEEE